MVRVAVVVADDVQACGICLALDPDMVTRIDFVAIPRALDDDVARTFDLTHGAVAARADHDPSDLARVSLGAVGPDCTERLARASHALKSRAAARPAQAGRAAWTCATRLASRAATPHPRT